MVYAQAGTIPSVCWGIPEAAQQSFETTLAQSSSLICLDKVQLSQCRPTGKARNQAALAGDHWICQTDAAKRNAVKKKLACLPERHPVLQRAPQLSASQNVRISERDDGGLAGHNGMCRRIPPNSSLPVCLSITPAPYTAPVNFTGQGKQVGLR